MKKALKNWLVVFIFAIISYFSLIYTSPQKEIGRSYMRTRPWYFHLSQRNAGFHTIEYGVHKLGSSLQILGGYTRSMPRERQAVYFLPEDKNCLLVSGSDWDDTDKFKRDIVAEWLNLPSSFRGNLSLCPEQEQTGMLLHYHQAIDNIIGLDYFKHTFIEIFVPWQHVENNLNLQQSNVQGAFTDPNKPGDILQAFKQASWKNSKIDGSKKDSGFAEVKLVFGKTYIDERDHQLIYYSTLIVPVNSRPNHEFMFNPVIGFDKHVGIGGGADIQVRLNRDHSYGSFMFFTGLEATFYVRNKQFRTFDLKDKPWSRFVLYNIENCPHQSPQPGVNLLTQQALVRPYGVFDFTTGLRFRNNWVEFEVGYNVWGHDEETIKLRRPFVEKIGIASLGDPSKTTSMSTIALVADEDVHFVKIRQTDIDLKSAHMRSALNHKLHVAILIVRKGTNTAGIFGGGAYIDYAQKNAPLRMWGAWGKIGLAF
jgi:hypothetical protein